MASSLDASLDAMRKRLVGCAIDFPKLNARKLEGWSDELLAEMRTKVNFPDYAFDRANLRSILTRFYNFYFTGTIPSDDSVHATVYDTVALARTNDGPIWKAEDHRGDKFYEPNTSIPRDFKNIPLTVMPAVAAVDANQRRQIVDKHKRSMVNYSLNDIKLFRRSVYERIAEIDLVDGANRFELQLLSLSGFLALTLLRFATKDVNHVLNTFSMKRYKNCLSAFVGWPTGEGFVPPCSICLDMCLRGLQNGSYHVPKIFIILAHEYVLTTKPEYGNSSASKYLLDSVLASTARYGLGMIQKLEDTCLVTQKSWKELITLTYCSVTMKSWSRIVDFFLAQNNKRGVQHSFNWARIINNGYFREVSLKENEFLATVFAAVIEQVRGPAVWNANFGVGNRVRNHDAVLLGRELYSQCVSTLKKQDHPQTTCGPSCRRKQRTRHRNDILEAPASEDWD